MSEADELTDAEVEELQDVWRILMRILADPDASAKLLERLKQVDGPQEANA